jgi:hypothetical protein
MADGVSRRRFLAGAAAGAAGLWALPGLALGEEKKLTGKKVEESITQGLQYLKKVQAKDGHWAASNGAYKSAMTGLAGMAFLMEGSTLQAGKYTDQIKRAVEWCTAPARLQPNGLIADRRGGGDFDNYMHGHGYATMFLACAYGEGEDAEEQRKLEKAVTKAVEFTCKAQTHKKHRLAEGKTVEIGGWGYVSATERDFDEGSVTATALQALRAAKNAGIQVPKENIDRAVNYLEVCTTSKGGVIYSYSNSGGVAVAGQERPPLTAAAVCCGYSAGQYKGELPKKWLKFCKDNISLTQHGRDAHEEYRNYYFAQCVYALGEERYGEMFPNEPKESWLKWSKFREAMFPYLINQQQKDGSWTSGFIGPVYTTAVNLAVLQLEKGLLPIYQR